MQHNLDNCAIGNLGFKLIGSRVEKYVSIQALMIEMELKSGLKGNSAM